MEDQTFRSRLLELLQRSRKAMRLYASMGRTHGRVAAGTDFSETQAAAWQSTNADLVKRLGAVLEQPQVKKLAADVIIIRDQMWSDFRNLESELHVKQRELIGASESGDFVSAATLSLSLVSLKAKLQATQAAHHELEMVIRRSKVSGETIELSGERVVLDGPSPASAGTRESERSALPRAGAHANPIQSSAKIIPLRKVGQ